MTRPAARTLAGVVAERAATDPASPAIIERDGVVSYAELHGRAMRVARGLTVLGVMPGERVAALLGNEAAWVELALAASAIGATFVPLNTWYKPGELAWTLRHCNVGLLVAARQVLKTDYGATLAALIADAGAAPRHVVVRGEPVPGAIGWWDMLAAGDALADPDPAAVDPDTIAYILYTSGSTADPKGVMLAHRGVVENGFDLGHRRAIHAADRTWLGTPLFYALGATNALPATLTAGAALVLEQGFEAGAAIDLIRRTGATVFYGTGNISRAIVDHPDFSRAAIGTLAKGNAGLGAGYKRLTLIEMGITGAVPAYGLTETYGNAAVGDPDDPLEVKLATDGRPLPGMAIAIVDPATGAPLPPGEAGLILVRGHVTPGYHANPVETAKACRPDGFFDTGDLGRLDADGRLIFQSRLKEVIKSGGINVSPVEVEQLLAAHPDVRDAHVVGVADARRGEVIVAFVDRRARISEETLRGYVKERAAAFKVPHHILFRSESQLPRLATGKIAKVRLVEEARRELGL